jgi:hypothetical protein
MKLDKVSTEELERELAKRKEAQVMEAPTPLANPDFSAMTAMIVEGTNGTAKTGREDSDFQIYVYEAAMTAVYGEDFFDWLNERLMGE